MTARLYLDEDITPLLSRLLREGGVDAVSAHEIGNRGLTDNEQLARAAAEGRTIVSCNHRDFVRIAREWAEAGREHAGIITSYQQIDRDRVGLAARRLTELLNAVTEDDLANTLRVIDTAPDLT